MFKLQSSNTHTGVVGRNKCCEQLKLFFHGKNSFQSSNTHVSVVGRNKCCEQLKLFFHGKQKIFN
jgi:hypothetical protein